MHTFLGSSLKKQGVRCVVTNIRMSYGLTYCCGWPEEYYKEGVPLHAYAWRTFGIRYTKNAWGTRRKLIIATPKAIHSIVRGVNIVKLLHSYPPPNQRASQYCVAEQPVSSMQAVARHMPGIASRSPDIAITWKTEKANIAVLVFLRSKVLCALIWNLHSLSILPSPLCVGSFKTKQSLNFWPKDLVHPCIPVFSAA